MFYIFFIMLALVVILCSWYVSVVHESIWTDVNGIINVSN